MTEKEQFPSHKQILSDLLQSRINTKTITEYLNLLDDLYYGLPGKPYPKWLSRCNDSSLIEDRNSFEVQIIINLADEIFELLKPNKITSIDVCIDRYGHIDSNLVRLAINYLRNEGKIEVSNSEVITRIPTLEDRKKILIGKIIASNSKDMLYALEDSLEQYLEKLSEEIPF